MKIFCSGIGGIGLSAYAALQNAEGHSVSGSDRIDSELLADLRTQGITVLLMQDGSDITKDTDLFVFSEAIPEEAPERIKARELGIRSISYFQALGEYLRERNLRVIAVCGTHGKSSTTAMAAKVFADAGKEPTVVVGTKVPDLGGRNWRRGTGSLAIIEACEYRGSFLYLDPALILMTTVDGDHFDVYPSLEEYRKAFVSFAQKLPKEGQVITHGKDSAAVAIAETAKRTLIDADAIELPTLSSAVPGLHMRQNAALVMTLAHKEGIPQDVAEKSLQNFRGTWRRMELKGTLPGDILVCDDYAHHPKEISATVTALKAAYPGRRIVCAFQPHLRSRTHQFYDGFTKAFAGADIVLISDPYEARSDTSPMLNMTMFTDDISKSSKVSAEYSGTLITTEQRIAEIVKPRDLLLIMGAGSIGDLAGRILHS